MKLTSFGINKRNFVDIEPFCRWQKEEEQDILEVHVRGFKREQLRVKVNNLGVLTINCERPLDQIRWCRFNKDFNLARECKPSEIRAKLSKGILYITIPKSKTPLSNVSPQYDHQEDEKPDQERTKTGFLTVLRNSIPKVKVSKKTAFRLTGGIFAVMVLIGIGTFLICKYRQTFHDGN